MIRVEETAFEETEDDELESLVKNEFIGPPSSFLCGCG